MKTKILIGCSAFYNSHWIDIFYPPGLARSKWFEFYCSHFNTYEMNGTFYKFPSVRTMESWYDKAPDDFIYAVKAPKLFTHLKQFRNVDTELEDFYSICRSGLREKLGSILFQFPPGFKYSEEALMLIIGKLDYSFCNVIEFRHESWWNKSVYDILKINNISFCSVNYPKLPDPVINTSLTGYARLHGNPKLFYSEYDDAALDKLLAGINGSGFEKAFVYFNNTAGTGGILNALKLKEKSV